MKVRKGFVSNSSSSSFIVPFPKGFEPTQDNVMEYLFKGEGKYMSYYDCVADLGRVTQVIANDMVSQDPNKNEKLVEVLSGNADLDLDDFKTRPHDVDPNRLTYDWDAYNAATEQAAKIKFEEFMKKIGVGYDLYLFEYSDNDGEFFCVMEHGGTFENVQHLRISHH